MCCRRLEDVRHPLTPPCALDVEDHCVVLPHQCTARAPSSPLMHPSSRKLYNTLARAKHDNYGPHIGLVLEEISKNCETCQLYSPCHLVFDPENVRFDQMLLVGITVFKDESGKNCPVLHIVEGGANFGSFHPELIRRRHSEHFSPYTGILLRWIA